MKYEHHVIIILTVFLIVSFIAIAVMSNKECIAPPAQHSSYTAPVEVLKPECGSERVEAFIKGYEECESVEKETFCIHNRYRQIKDTMKSETGNIFRWNDNGYWLENVKYFESEFMVDKQYIILEKPFYTREEILNKEYFEPISTIAKHFLYPLVVKDWR